MNLTLEKDTGMFCILLVDFWSKAKNLGEFSMPGIMSQRSWEVQPHSMNYQGTLGFLKKDKKVTLSGNIYGAKEYFEIKNCSLTDDIFSFIRVYESVEVVYSFTKKDGNVWIGEYSDCQPNDTRPSKGKAKCVLGLLPDFDASLLMESP